MEQPRLASPFILPFLLLFHPSLHAAAPALLNEVATEETQPGSDWVEIAIATKSADLAGWKLYEQNTPVKTFPKTGMLFTEGAFLVLHFNSAEPDETPATGDANENGCFDLYTNDSGLTGTSNVLSLRNASGTIVDALVYTNNASWTSTQQSAFDLVVGSRQWIGTLKGGATTNYAESVRAPGGVGEGHSLAREPGLEDSDSAPDWSLYKTPSPGRANPSLNNCPRGSGNAPASLNEVAPSVLPSQGGDFVEIYLSEAGNLCGMKLYEGETLIKTFPSVTARSGTFGAFLLLHAAEKNEGNAEDESDAAGDTNGNGVIDLYSDESSPGLSGSISNSLTLEKADGTPIDFLSWSVPPENGYPEELRGRFDAATRAGLWAPPCAGNASCCAKNSVAWGNFRTQSMARRRIEKSSIPAALGWMISSPSPGRENPPANSAGGGRLSVLQSPFSPYGDHPRGFSEAILSFEAPAGAALTLRIFDAEGRIVRTLLDQFHPAGAGAQAAAWDGKNDAGEILPVGIYLAQLILETADGAREKETKSVVLGRPL